MSAPTGNEPTSAPVETEYDQLMNHEYDGIREYDNPLPFWWVWLWAASFFFSIGYVAWYHMGKGPSIQDQYEVAVTRAVEKQLAGLGEIRSDDETILRLMKDEDMMDAVAGMFRGNCAQCHGNEGGGNIGPNLTDDHFKNVTRPEDLYTIIADGIVGTSMPAWSQRLREPQMILLASYVASLRGTTPTGTPLGEEGDEIEPWSAFETAGDGTDEPTDAAGAAEADASADARSARDRTGDTDRVASG